MLWWVLGIAISAVFGYFAFREIQWAALARMHGNVNWLIIVLAASIVAISFCLRAVRWRFLLPGDVAASYRVRFSGVAIGYLVSNFLPARLGDFVRPAYLSRRTGAALSVSLLSVASERVWDLMFLVGLFLVLTSAGVAVLPEQLQIDRRILVVIAIAGIVVLFAAQSLGRAIGALLNSVGLTRLGDIVAGLQKAFQSTSRASSRRNVFFITSAIFATEVAFFAAMIHAIGLSVSLIGSALVMVITALSFLLPSAPGGVGVYHFFCQAALIAVGIPRPDAIAAAIFIHATLFLVVTVVGLMVVASDFWGTKDSHERMRNAGTESPPEIE